MAAAAAVAPVGAPLGHVLLAAEAQAAVAAVAPLHEDRHPVDKHENFRAVVLGKMPTTFHRHLNQRSTSATEMWPTSFLAIMTGTACPDR